MKQRSPSAEQVRALRQKAGLNRSDFGALVSVSGRTVQSYEQGARLCPPDRYAYWKLRVQQKREEQC